MPRRNKRSSEPNKNTEFAVRYKNGGSFLTLHFPANTPEQAVARVPEGSKILGVRKVRSDHIIGDLKSMHLEDIIGIGRRQPNVILEDTSLESIVFPNIRSKASKSRKKFKGKYNQSRRFSDEAE